MAAMMDVNSVGPIAVKLVVTIAEKMVGLTVESTAVNLVVKMARLYRRLGRWFIDGGRLCSRLCQQLR